jgi:glutathione peroxidase
MLRETMLITAVFMAADVGGAGAADKPVSAFEHAFKSIDGGEMALSQYKGKALLVVNTASFCGFTRQYEALQKLWERYQAKGLVVIGVPSNDFGAQEPNSEAQIKTFCEGNFGITFPMTAKVEVKGRGAHPFYAWAASTMGQAAVPQWNFHKLLIGRDGRGIATFTSRVEPLSGLVIEAVEKALAAKP